MLTTFRQILKCESLVSATSCFVSTKYQRPFPRPFRRRLFEAAVAPVLPVARGTCPSQMEYKENLRKRFEEYSEVDLALVKHVKKWIKTQGFHLMAICQELPVKAYAVWLAKNRFRLQGLELRKYEPRIVKKIFEGTPLQSLEVVFNVPGTCFLFGKDLESMKAVVKECKRYAWIHPLAITFDSHILSVEEAEKLCKLESFEVLRGETVQILDSFPQGLVSTINSSLESLSMNLDAYGYSRKNEDLGNSQ